MNTCLTCKHRTDDKIETWRCDDDGNELPITYYGCERIAHGNKSGGSKEYKAGEKALAVDGSGYHAKLVVEPDFGCVLHEPRGD